jgi:transcriptional regulator with XRE-family HTH domain
VRVQTRINFQLAGRQRLDLVGAALGDQRTPLGNRGPTDSEFPRHLGAGPEMIDNGLREHIAMVTIVHHKKQPQLTELLLTYVHMSTLQERLLECMGDKWTQADLARECGISRTAVTKWLKDTKQIEAQHIFTLARLFRVDPEWLATGKGRKERGAAQIRADLQEIPPRRLELIRRYGELPREQRSTIRALIESLSPGEKTSTE